MTTLVPPVPGPGRSVVAPEVHAARVLLLARGLNQKRMARALGVSNSTLSRVLNGHQYHPALVQQLWILLTSRELDDTEARG